MLKERRPAPTDGATLTAAPFTVAKKYERLHVLHHEQRRGSARTPWSATQMLRETFSGEQIELREGEVAQTQEGKHRMFSACFLLCEVPTSTCSDVPQT